MSTVAPRMTAPSDLYESLGGTARSDADLLHAIGERLQVPREEPANSFVLHAPLELLARAALLPWVRTEGRQLARLRMVAVLAEYEAEPAADLNDEPLPVTADASTSAAGIVTALIAADLAAADRWARSFAASARPHELTPLLGAAVLPSLAAAGHASIFLYLYPRVAPRGEATLGLIRPLVRELARYPELRLDWIADRSTAGAGSAGALAEVMARVPVMGVPGSTFIYPVMHQVDHAGVAADLLGTGLDGIGIDDAERVLLRAAARAMLVGTEEHVPYGWTHALTMSQAALAVARGSLDPQLGIDVAGTYVVGILAALATGPLPREVAFDHPGGTFPDAIAAGREAAAGWVWNAPDDAIAGLRSDLATRASANRDAHVVKYVLACLDQAAADPEALRLYLAAAAALLGHWSPIHDADDPLDAPGGETQR